MAVRPFADRHRVYEVLMLMRRFAPLVFLAVALLAASVIGCAGVRRSGETGDDEGPVGVRTLAIVDAERGRELTTEVWYPAATGPESSQGYMYFYRSGSAARDAAPKPGKHPLIVVSHGSGGTRFDQAWLAERLAARGFVVAATTHPGNAYASDDPYVSLRIWERPQDVRFVIDALLVDDTFAPVIDPQRIGAAGHSMGGYTVLAVGGARYDVHRARRHCAATDRDPPCKLVPDVDKSRIDYGPSDDSYKDPRVKAIMAFAPAVGPGLNPDSISDVDADVHIVAARHDQLTPFPFHAQAWATALDAELTVLGEADHYSFVSPCLPFIKLWPWANACRDPDGLDRQQLHRRLAGLAASYFKQRL
jgi:predicted dienelactone hydrolase